MKGAPPSPLCGMLGSRAQATFREGGGCDIFRRVLMPAFGAFRVHGWVYFHNFRALRVRVTENSHISPRVVYIPI